jgi:hypothetical protein
MTAIATALSALSSGELLERGRGNPLNRQMAVSPDGRTLYFIREPSQLFAVSMEAVERLRPPL